VFSNKSGVLAIVVAALLPTCFAGWLVWDSLRGPGGGDETQRVLPLPSVSASASPRTDDANGAAAAGTPTASALPLAGKVVVLDPGHNPNNRDHTSEIARRVDIGTNEKECDTTGTATESGYAEASFTLDVSRRARALLEARGATVKFTQDDDRPYGPCVDERARIGNSAHADAVVSVHADGAPAGDRGFHVILPKSVRGGGADTSEIAAPSRRLGEQVRSEFMDATGSAPADYIGDGSGLNVRGDLGGLNLSTVPKVFIECGNMRDSKDAAELTDPKWRERAALGIAQGITDFLNR